MAEQIEIHNDYYELYNRLIDKIYDSIRDKNYEEVEIVCPAINRCTPNPLFEDNKVKIVCMMKHGILFYILNDYYGRRFIEDSKDKSEVYIETKAKKEYESIKVYIRPINIQFHIEETIVTYIDIRVYYRKGFSIHGLESLMLNYPEYEFYIENIEGGN